MEFDKVWFTSDHHFGHGNIIKYNERPYSNSSEMNEDLIEKWNDSVDIDDIVYHLGDFTLGNRELATYYFRHLNGFVHILSNFWHHDKRWIIEKRENYFTKNGFTLIIEHPIVVLEIGDLGTDGYPLAITLCHYPIGEWERKHYGAWHLHGHSHSNYHAEGKILDVGVDSAYLLLGEYRPFSLSEIIEIMDKK